MAIHKDMPILLVDDDKNILEIYSHILTQNGFQSLFSVHSGSETLDLLGISHAGKDINKAKRKNEKNIELVILDVILPDINGFDVCRWIKNAISPFLPVILVSGYDHVRGIEAGADYFLTKPINFDELVAKVNALLERKEKFNRLHSVGKEFGTTGTRYRNMMPSIGDEINHYQCIDSLGWGGCAVIYKVEDIVGGQTFAMKMLAKYASLDEDIVRRFVTEVEMMREVEHPNVLRVVDQGEYAECPYYVMEYVQGRTLDALLEDTPRIAIAEILRIAEGVALALRAIHKSNIVHRDIKLKNIYVGDDAEVKLGDFGVAVKIGDARLTQTGYSVGTPIYMAPEQFEGGAVTAATDVYSYGAAMYHLITGKPPFTAANAMELMRKHFTATPAPMCSVRRDLPEEWDILVVDNCLAKNSRDRPQSIEAVLEVLNMIRDISPIQDADC